jgi:hypothetical protein
MARDNHGAQSRVKNRDGAGRASMKKMERHRVSPDWGAPGDHNEATSWDSGQRRQRLVGRDRLIHPNIIQDMSRRLTGVTKLINTH